MSLADRWPLSTGTVLRDALLAAYSSPTRAYHDLRHLREVLDRLDELAAGGEEFDRTTVALAAWFHDGVYDGARGAEERSARWAERDLPGTGLTGDQVAEVARLVRLTEHHRPDDHDDQGRALSDADLAILAADDERYADYTADVRREYAAVAEPDFRAGRAAVLHDLLAAPHLFATAYGREHWEARARANVAAELGTGP